ncbi:hypothetical protein [Ilumatobacter sp.]|uniref:hypothetical protein n=1 Tax=Ilumatobacter sp. TaxID=1967498 RepID=UPI003B52101E
MEPAPLPPHERTWRHPSELAPTVDDVDPGWNGRGWVLAAGTVATMMAAVMVLALSPPRSPSPTAVSATTVPAATIRLQTAAPSPSTATTGPSAAPDGEATQTVRMNRTVALPDRALALVGAPIAVSRAGRSHDRSVAPDLPAADDRVIVLTVSHTYDVSWGHVARLAAPDGSIVMTVDGQLVASWVDGELRILVS